LKKIVLNIGIFLQVGMTLKTKNISLKAPQALPSSLLEGSMYTKPGTMSDVENKPWALIVPIYYHQS